MSIDASFTILVISSFLPGGFPTAAVRLNRAAMIPPRRRRSRHGARPERDVDMLAPMDSRTLQTITRLTARERLLIASLRGAPMDESADKLAALADVVRALDRLGASHAVIGGVAVGLRSGVPRATVDTDLAVRSTVERQSIVEALTGAGLRLTAAFPHSLHFRHQSGEAVRIIFDPEFDPMIDRAEPLDVAGVRIYVVTTADLIAMKERAAADPGRRRSKALRDQADIELLLGDVPDPDEGW
jgi:hypothetical protein